MSAWTKLLAASSIAIGNAWDLITHPRTGTGSDVYIEQISSRLLYDTITSTFSDVIVSSVVCDDTITSTLSITDVESIGLDSLTTVEVV